MSRKTFWEADGQWHWVDEGGSIGDRCPEPTVEERAAAEEEHQRRLQQRRADDSGQVVWWRGHRFAPGAAAPAPVPGRRAKPGTREYRVITQRDDHFKSRFSPEALQDLVNALAADGWRVVSMSAADAGTFSGGRWGKGGGPARQELVVLLERTVE